MEKIGSYVILELLVATRGSILFRARREGDKNTVIVKVLKAESFIPSEIARFKREYEIIRQADIDGIVKTLDIVPHHRSFALILEDFDGISLSEFMKTRTISLAVFLKIGISLAETLGDLHQKNIIHKDIKPHNILIDRQGGTVKFTDFGVSAEMTGEYAEIFRPDMITGTLLYMSPEQTGRMNRAVDYRTDLYSLGATFYHMLTGSVPFKSDDPLEIIHAHIAKNPVPPDLIRPSVPRAVSNIIMKLLSKTAEDRYQNCYGLMADLLNCLKQLEQSGVVEEFELGRHDVSIRFNILQKIFGREKELDTLMNSFERVSAGSSEIILVTGQPGIGKSSLIQEVYKPITARRGYFTSGKYDQFRKNVPYNAIIQAIQRLMRQILSEDEKMVREWRERISESLEPNGRIITDYIPELELIIGKQPEVAALDPEETQNRFNLVIKNFLRVLCTQDHPLAIFLDDMQWADAASLKIIKNLICDSEVHHILLIGAYRDSEVNTADPLMITMQEIKKSGITVQTILLPPLDANNVNAMIAGFLRCREEESSPLAELVHAKTAGNPFFVNQFLKILYDEHMLRLDPDSGWQWDMARIKQMRVTDNVVELMAKKITGLSPNTARIIQVCACVGNRFDLELLAHIVAQSIEETLDDLSEAISAGLISQADTSYVFQHDRIQEAATSLIPEKQRTDLHYRIGSIILANTDEEDLRDNIFYIVNHLNQGVECISSAEERINLARLNLIASEKAKNSTAYTSALLYIRSGINLLTADSWQNEYELTYSLYKELMECEYLNLNYTESERIFTIILRYTHSNVDKAELYRIHIVLCSTIGKYETSIKLAREGLKLFGIHIPVKPTKLTVLRLLFDVWRLKKYKTLEEIMQMPDMTNKEKSACMQITNVVESAAYILDTNLFATIVLIGTRLILKYGNSEISPINFMTLSTILGPGLGLHKLSFKIAEMALILGNRYPQSKNRSSVEFVFSYLLQHWKRHARENIEYLRESYKISLQNGDISFAAHSVNIMVMQRIMIGDNLDDIIAEYKQYEHFLKNLNAPFVGNNFSENVQFYLCLKGLTTSRTSLNSGVFNEKEQLEYYKKNNNTLGIFYYLLIRIRVYYLFGDYRAAYDTGQEMDKIVETAVGNLHVPEFYFYHTLAMMALYRDAPFIEKKILRKKLKAYLKLMKTWSENCPENFLHKYLLIMAEQARIRNRHEEAMDLYHRAIASAKENDYTQNQGIANELAARFYLDRGFPELAQPHITEARLAYLTWGASAKVRDLEEKYPEFMPRRDKKEKTDKEDTLTDSKTRTIEEIDLQTVIKISHALSGEIDLDRLISRLLEIAIENAGAQKGCILLERAEELSIEAQGMVGEQGFMALESPAASYDDIPQSVVNYVRRTGKLVVLGNAVNDETFGTDPAIIRLQTKSVLCMPIKEQNRIIGILYLENNLSNDAFTSDRIDILGILTSQAAISMKNALLYADRKQAEEQLLAEKERLSVTLRSIGEGVIATGTDKLITLMNKAAEQLTGWTQNEAVGKSFVDVFRILDENTRANVLVDPLDEVFIKSNTMEISLTPVLVGRDGTEKAIAYTVAPISDHMSRVIGAIIVFRDITEKQKMENEMLKSQKLESLSVFAGGIAHDFNNILTGVIGNISLVMMKMKADDEQYQRLSQVEKASLRARDLTHQLLTFSRGGNPIKKALSIATLLQESVHFALSGTNIKCEFAIPEDIWPVDADEGQINQVINNLIINACQSMPDGGVISITALNAMIDGQNPLPLSSGEYVKISIRDEGIGIPKENLQKIFDPFFTTKLKGTGLGLSSTFSIIKKHGGHITVDSRVGEGATFHFYLPASEDKTLMSHAEVIREHTVETGRVLIMDDEEMIRKTGCNILKQLGYDADAVLDGEEAIAKYKEALSSGRPYDLVIMDLTVPGRLGGKEAIQKMIEIDPNVKAIASSGYSNDPVMHDFVNYGFCGIIVKPYRVIDMREAVWKALK
jgi:PAS domain S-box-containing protein